MGILWVMNLLEKAIRLAVEAHTGQVDKAGRPYVLHPLAVMFAAERAYNVKPVPGVSLEEFMAAAVLHDVPEDHPEKYPLSYILAEFGENVHRMVDGVTRRKGEVYMDFIARANEDTGSRLLKILDIHHNLGRIHVLPIAGYDEVIVGEDQSQHLNFARDLLARYNKTFEQSIKRRYERALARLDAADFWFLLEK